MTPYTPASSRHPSRENCNVCGPAMTGREASVQRVSINPILGFRPRKLPSLTACQAHPTEPQPGVDMHRETCCERGAKLTGFRCGLRDNFRTTSGRSLRGPSELTRFEFR